LHFYASFDKPFDDRTLRADLEALGGQLLHVDIFVVELVCVADYQILYQNQTGLLIVLAVWASECLVQR
jgi:hypothetical protein